MARMVCLLLLFITSYNSLLSVSVGSNTAASVQPFTIFPSADTNNTMLGFAAFDRGFLFGSLYTTCTYDDYLPVRGSINLSGGSLYLKKDLKLANTHAFVNGGYIFGRSNSLEMPAVPQDLLLCSYDTTFAIGSTPLVTSSYLLNDVQTMDWDYTGSYLLGGSNQPNGCSITAAIFYFDGSSLTTTKPISPSSFDTNCVKWHPMSWYFAAGINRSTNLTDLRAYKFVPSTGVLTLTGNDTSINGAINAIAWHPSGNYFVIATSATSQGLVSYSFNPTTGAIAQISTLAIPNNPAPQIGSLSFSPDGAYIAVGVAKNAGNEIHVCSFSSGTMAIVAGAEANNIVPSVAWNPTSSNYILATANGNLNNNVVFYRFNSGSNTLTQISSFSTGIINMFTWDPYGRYLSVGYHQPQAGYGMSTYYYDQTANVLTQVQYELILARQQNDGSCIAFPPNGSGYFALSTNDTNSINIFRVNYQSPLIFDNTCLVLNSNLIMQVSAYFRGNCKILAQGKNITLNPGKQFIVRPGGSLIIEDAIVNGVYSNAITCMNHNGSVWLKNSSLSLSGNYTFSTGSMAFFGYNELTGSGAFTYGSALTSTINSLSTLFIDQGISFNYAPSVAKNNLLKLTDQSSCLYLNGCSLASTFTGLLLSTGTVCFDNNVTLSSSGRNSGEALTLDSSLVTRVKGNAHVVVAGCVKSL